MTEARDREPRAPHHRRPFVDLAPPTTARGDDAWATLLFDALTAAAEGVVEHEVPHGFHSWPAGMPPAIAAAVMDSLAEVDGQKAGVVVDPFSGGGTVALEAVLHRRPFLGVDLNPLSARVGAARTTRRSPGEADVLLTVVEAVVQQSTRRVRERVRVRAEVPDDVAAAYAPHVLLELAGLLEEIAAVDDDEHRRTLAVVFSSILTKVSRRRGDTGSSGREHAVVDGEKRVGRFFASEFFGRKAQELIGRQVALFHRVGPSAPKPRFLVDDARRLPALLQRAWGRKAALVLTSPPYGGTYDYARHHAHRLAWLGLDGDRFARDEIGARRRRDRGVDDFDHEIAEVLQGIAASLADDGVAILLMGDGEVGGQRLAADRQLDRLAPDAGLVVDAVASAPRPDWRGGPPREEHLIAMRLSPSSRR